MKDLQVTARVPANKEKGTPELGPVTITVKTGENAVESIKMFGDEAVKSNSDENWIVTRQGNIISGLRRGETAEQMQARIGGAKMGVAAAKAQADPKQAWLVKDPKSLRLPVWGLGTTYIIALEDYYFVYPTNYSEYKRQYLNSFQHGGISPDEMILPVAVLRPK